MDWVFPVKDHPALVICTLEIEVLDLLLLSLLSAGQDNETNVEGLGQHRERQGPEKYSVKTLS